MAVGDLLNNGRALPAAVAGMALAFAASQSQALTITPYFDSSITGAANAAEIENRINSAIGFYGAFSNNADVRIIFQIGDTPLGASTATLYGPINSSSYIGLLAQDAAAHPENTVLNGALPYLGTGNHLRIDALSANLRALGDSGAQGVYGVDGSFNMGGDYDGIVILSNVTNRIAYGSTVNNGQYGANQVIQHEVDEILGVGGAGSFVGISTSTMGAEDLYRYSGFHAGSFTTNTNAQAYFSLDGGTTDLINFNQSGTGDYGDWAKSGCGGAQHVQDWQGCPEPTVGQFGLTVNSIEVKALQAIGYNLAVPEPSTWALLIAGFGMVGTALRQRRRLAA